MIADAERTAEGAGAFDLEAAILEVMDPFAVDGSDASDHDDTPAIHQNSMRFRRCARERVRRRWATV